MARLCVNIDHVATLRQARRGIEPEPIFAVGEVELGGSSGVTVHLREDQRHIQERDVRLIREVVQGHLNLEMAAAESVVEKALRIRPDIATLVPERREEVTTEGGLDVRGNLELLRKVTERLRDAGIRVSMFIDPEGDQIDASLACGADEVELHTGQYALARKPEARLAELRKLYHAARQVHAAGLVLNAGHGLNYSNVQAVAAIPHLQELNIGHAIVSRAVFVGLRSATAEMLRLIDIASRSPEAARPAGLGPVGHS
ncbi:MAG: Pyridoxine 5'-phosphate synthase [candidate division BRC1 bacterium ADurb.BinA292]|nr:MAG: Pyridoxine 5'-phosphate synthase [candidate division BRC1 bacterium ADurb.BinA292]